MKKISGAVLIIIIYFTLAACHVEPEPLRFGKDGCHRCKMTLTDNKFGAEIVTTKGKIYKFDDINCMLGFYNSEKMPPEKFQDVLIIDFSNPEKLIDAKKALYIKSESIKTPMASNIAAFESEYSAKKVNSGLNGIRLRWNDLQTN